MRANRIDMFLFWQGNDFEDHTKYAVCIDDGKIWKIVELRCQTNGTVVVTRKVLPNRDVTEEYIKELTKKDNAEAGF